MILKSLNFLRGSIRVRVTCPYPERFLNLCAENGVEFWELERKAEHTMFASLPIRGYRTLVALADGANFAISPLEKRGVPFFFWGIRKRYVLLLGMVVMFICLAVSSLFIWEIDVTGNHKVSSSEIRKELRALGVDIGTFGPDIVTQNLSNEILQKIPELSFLTVNVKGSRANVIVRERVQAPDIVDEKTPTMIYALKPGIIVKMSVLQGSRLKKEGDTVQAGDLLVTGAMDSKFSGTRFVHAMAEITARTWYDMSAQMPLTVMQKKYTGRTETKTAVLIAGKRLNFYFNSGIQWQDYDKMTTTSHVRLPTGNVLPVTVVTERLREYEMIRAFYDEKTAEAQLEQGLIERLKLALLNGTITKTDFSTEVSGGVITVRMKAECSEQIAGMRDLTESERNTDTNQGTGKSD